MGWLAGEAEGGYPEAPGVMGAGILALLPDSRGAPGGSHTCPHLSPHLHLLDLSHSVAPPPRLALSIEQTHPSLVPGAVPWCTRSIPGDHLPVPRGHEQGCAFGGAAAPLGSETPGTASSFGGRGSQMSCLFSQRRLCNHLKFESQEP